MSQYPPLATELGAPLHGGDPYLPSVPLLNLLKRPYYIEGGYRGRHLKIYNFTRGSGKNSSPYHAVRVTLNRSTDLTFKLGVEGFFSKIGKAVGMQDIQTGDPAFDETFVVKCNDTGFVHGALLPEIRQSLLSVQQRFPRRFGSISLNGAWVGPKDNVIHYEHSGHLRHDGDRQRAAALAPALNDLADAIEAYATI
ncbi:hypothetical protein [Cerasicoccus fimbriatus]|uniref:hypothetical protein n=1 Tax=Cerasicoccus fimbriatus TaxID=3014554 RepID=UPI0022B306A1|nr:hypothetical protein [Cerasicoccus sp. TK19100]